MGIPNKYVIAVVGFAVALAVTVALGIA